MKSRIAPTPSGFLHRGNLASFFLTQQIVRQHNGNLLLRIDDLDRERYRTKYAENIFRVLKQAGIDWNEGPQNFEEFELRWSQQRRLAEYNRMNEQLKQTGKLYACTCSRQEKMNCTCAAQKIDFNTAGAKWKLKTYPDQEFQLVEAFKGKIPVRLIARDITVKRANGMPAYPIASIADDLHFGITHIVRGMDLWDSTLAQLYISHILGLDAFLNIEFFHHPLLHDGMGAKLSKSAGNALTGETWSNEEIDFCRQIARTWLHEHGH